MTKVLGGGDGDQSEPGMNLDGLARQGARQMIAGAMEAQVAECVARDGGERDEEGRALVVRNGRARPRKVTLGAGTVEIRAPRGTRRWGEREVHEPDPAAVHEAVA